MKRASLIATLALCSATVHAREGSLCDQEAATTCGAGHLPRVTDRDWSPAEIAHFRARAEHGTVAVAYTSGKPRLVPDCALDGKYTEVQGQPGSGRLWASNRVLLLPEEATGAGCAHATHLAATFAIRGTSFAALLVPLPGSPDPARTDRAHALLRSLPADEQEHPQPEHALTAYALAPNDYLTLQRLARINGECALHEHAQWILRQYVFTRDREGNNIVARNHRRDAPYDAPPRLDEQLSQRSCLNQPVFRKCFPELFQPSPGVTGCWAAAAAKPGARAP